MKVRVLYATLSKFYFSPFRFFCKANFFKIFPLLLITSVCACRSSKKQNESPAIFFSDFYLQYGDTLNQTKLAINFDTLAQKYIVEPIHINDTVTFGIALYSESVSITSFTLTYDTISLWMAITDRENIKPILLNEISDRNDLFFLPGYSAISFFIRYAPLVKNTCDFTLNLFSDEDVFPCDQIVFSQNVDSI